MRTAILVSQPINRELEHDAEEGLCPTPDFIALSKALKAKIISPLHSASGKKVGHIGKTLELFSVAWAGFKARNNYDLIISDLDRVGLLLAFLFKLTFTRKHHIIICHGKIANKADLRAIRWLGLQNQIDKFVCYGPNVAGRLAEGLKSSDKVVTVRHSPDHHFWRPYNTRPERLIVSAGLFRRDYPTLIKAIEGLDVSLVIAADSPWVTDKWTAEGASLPPNVRVVKCTYSELRELYARALLIAIPLVNSGAQSGSLVIYEAMAMGKAVAATQTPGQSGLKLIREGETGHYIKPGDVEGWRSVINHLLLHPGEAERMGAEARCVIEKELNIDKYVSEILSVVSVVAPGEPQASVASFAEPIA